ncbi:MAG: hypothetical protein H6621_03250 [Halobacteriovoraceae bacterium]|nr:hypothetical protein [Halobacteriovoraceae bacterium]MCB9094063.1 hypothetical protein [Halobacteriovoraceae bacterium]
MKRKWLLPLFVLLFQACSKDETNSLVIQEVKNEPIITDSLPLHCDEINSDSQNSEYLGHCNTLTDIPITFVFIDSAESALSPDPQTDAETAIDVLNQAFQFEGNQYIKFSLKEVKNVVDETYYNTSCNLLAEISSVYGESGTLTMIFVNDLEGGCAGVSYLWGFPSSAQAVTMAEYRFPFILNSFTPIRHEFAHLMGLHHTAYSYPGAAPDTGLNSFNKLLRMSYRLSEDRECPATFYYFIDPIPQNTKALSGTIEWNSYVNTMYPSFGNKPDDGFFTDGYDYAMSRAFSCWYSFALEDIE